MALSLMKEVLIFCLIVNSELALMYGDLSSSFSFEAATTVGAGSGWSLNHLI